MTDEQHSDAADLLDFELEPELPGWTKPVGIVSAVLASLGLGCGGCGIGVLFATPQLMKMAEQEYGPPPAVMLPTTLHKVNAAVGTVWAGLLLVAAIQTLRRRYAGRILHLIYAAVAIPLFIWGITVQLDSMEAIGQWAQANPSNKWSQRYSPSGSLIGLAVGVLLSVPWQLFCLAWFGFVKRKPDDFTGGHIIG